MICCYNAEDRILSTLRHLAEQVDIGFSWEVLIVDNASIDNTITIAQQVWSEGDRPCALRVLIEPKRGTMFARAAGIANARFRYLLFCDDDNWLNRRYVASAYEYVCKHPEIACVGGFGIVAVSPGVEVPRWVHVHCGSYGMGSQGSESGNTTFDKGCLYTAGAILDRRWLSVLYDKGFESSLKGRDGKSMVAGEDTELTYALKLIGGQLHYSADLTFYHFMPITRLSWTYLKKLWRAFGYSDFVLMPYKIGMGKIKNRSALSILMINMVLAVRYLMTSLLAREGDINILKFHRCLGAIQAVFLASSAFHRNREIVELLKRQQ